jgi:hypothetical protein
MLPKKAKKKDLHALADAAAADCFRQRAYIVDIRCTKRSSGTGFPITVDGQVFGTFSRIRCVFSFVIRKLCAVLCCAVLCCAVLCCAVLCCAVLCCAVLCCAVLCCAVLCW